MTDILVRCDGLCGPKNPGGVATYGWVAYAAGRRFASGRGTMTAGREATNNVAEYGGALAALRELGAGDVVPCPASDLSVTIESDSQLMVRQMNGIYAVRSPRIFPLYEQLCALSKDFGKVRFVWIPREQNKDSDLESRIAYVEHWRGRGHEPPACQFISRAELDEAAMALDAGDKAQAKLEAF